MSDDANNAAPQKEKKHVAGALIKVVIGLVLLVMGGVAIMRWWQELLIITRGVMGLFLILAGVITLAIARE